MLAKFPHLSGHAAFKVSALDLAQVPLLLKGQIAVSALDAEGELVDATSLQLPGVLDDLYAYDGELGATYEGDVPTLKLWAPAARSVTLHLYDSPDAEAATAVTMVGDPSPGVWSAAGDASWSGRFYLYEVEVYVRSTGQVDATG